MAMRGIQFHPLAPNAGLQIGSGVAKGLQDATANFVKGRHQNMQMAYQQAHMAVMQKQASALAGWRAQQTENLRQKQLGEDAQKLDYALALHHAGILPEQVTTAQIKGNLKDVLAKAKPQDQAVITNWIDQRRTANQPLTPAPLTPLESKSYEQRLTNESREGQTAARVQGSKDVATIRNDRPEASTDPTAIEGKAIQKRITDLSNQMSAVDKPNPITGMMADETIRATMKSSIQKRIDQETDNWHKLHTQSQDDAGQPSAQGASAQPQPGAGDSLPASAPGQKIPYADMKKAVKGDFIVSPDGKSMGAVSDVIDGMPHIDMSTMQPFAPTTQPAGPQPQAGGGN